MWKIRIKPKIDFEAVRFSIKGSTAIFHFKKSVDPDKFYVYTSNDFLASLISFSKEELLIHFESKHWIIVENDKGE
jgi:hypothetical protein